ncbi:MAG: PAS domain-containing protein [Acidobacteriota bacterium]
MARKTAEKIVPPDDSSFPAAVLRSRWLLVIAVTALATFGGESTPDTMHYALIGAMILSNVVLSMLRNRGVRLVQALEVITVVDVVVITLVVSWVDLSPLTLLAVFATLILAMALGRVGVVMGLMVLVCCVYAGYLYTELGPGLWRDVPVVLRVPFLFAIALHFASIASYLKKEKAEREEILATAKQQAERADHLSREQDRLRALSQIGRLALTSADAHPVRVLLEMTHRANKALGVSRAVLIVFPRNTQEQGWNGRVKDNSTEVRALSIEPQALQSILLDGKLTELHPGDDKNLLARVKVFFPDSNPFGSLLVAPIATDQGPSGALFLLDGDHTRKYNEGERDFFWTVALMTAAFIQARQKLEHELQLRTLITNAPVIMFAAAGDGTITLFEGRAAAVLRGSPGKRIGRSLFELVDNPEEAREAFERALGGRVAAGTMMLEGTLFETQYSPLRSVDGQIAGVMGVTTAILDAPAPRQRPVAAQRPVAPDAAPVPQGAAAPRPDPAARGSRRRRPEFPTAPADLKPTIPFADED